MRDVRRLLAPLAVCALASLVGCQERIGFYPLSDASIESPPAAPAQRLIDLVRTSRKVRDTAEFKRLLRLTGMPGAVGSIPPDRFERAYSETGQLLTTGRGHETVLAMDTTEQTALAVLSEEGQCLDASVTNTGYVRNLSLARCTRSDVCDIVLWLTRSAGSGVWVDSLEVYQLLGRKLRRVYLHEWQQHNVASDLRELVEVRVYVMANDPFRGILLSETIEHPEGSSRHGVLVLFRKGDLIGQAGMEGPSDDKRIVEFLRASGIPEPMLKSWIFSARQVLFPESAVEAHDAAGGAEIPKKGEEPPK